MSKIELPCLDIAAPSKSEAKSQIKTSYRDHLIREAYPDGLIRVHNAEVLEELKIADDKWLEHFASSRMNLKVANVIAQENSVDLPIDNLAWLQQKKDLMRLPNLGIDGVTSVRDFIKLSRGLDIHPQGEEKTSNLDNQSIQEIDAFTNQLIVPIGFENSKLNSKAQERIKKLNIHTVADLILVSNPEMKKAGITDTQKGKLLDHFEKVSGMTTDQRRSINANATLRYLLAMKNCVSKIC